MKKKTLIVAFVVSALLVACGGGTPTPTQPPPPTANELSTAFDAYTDLLQRLDIGYGRSGAVEFDFITEVENSTRGQGQMLQGTTLQTTNGFFKVIAGYDTLYARMFANVEGEGFSFNHEMYIDIEDGEVNVSMFADGEEMDNEGMLDNPSDFENMLALGFVLFQFPQTAITAVTIDGDTIRMTIDSEAVRELHPARNDGVRQSQIMHGNFYVEIVTSPNGVPLSATMTRFTQTTFEDQTTDTRTTAYYTFRAWGDDVMPDEPA